MTTAVGITVTLPQPHGGRRQTQWDVSEFEKVPPPKYRFAAPSLPWPWMDFNQDAPDVKPLSPLPGDSWSRYPQSHFGNWTPDQVKRCRMLDICKDTYTCKIHHVNVFKDGIFDRSEESERTREIPTREEELDALWKDVQPGNPHHAKLRVRALFVENMTEAVLKMLGARFVIEPFFFASSANWIPSRYQEDPGEKGDHITVVLPFIRVVNNTRDNTSPTPSAGTQDPEKKQATPEVAITDKRKIIDTQAPLVLSDEKVLLQDLLAIHMVRSVEENVIISYHHHSQLQKTTAKLLQSLVQRTGDSVYWQKLYGKSQDPTFVFLAILWYALYAWDEALEVLYAYLSATLESSSLDTDDISEADDHNLYTRELHKLQAHLLYYQQLLRDFSKSVEFVRDTCNPAMYHDVDDEEKRKKKREKSEKLLKLEANTLLSEIERLEKQRAIQSSRLQNAMNLAFSTVNIEDSKSMQKLTKATMRDSAAMKQISYLTMIFLPATYLASVFGMNVAEINPGSLETLRSYVVSTVILTVITTWVVIALQTHNIMVHGENSGILRRIAWPLFFTYRFVKEKVSKGKGKTPSPR